MRAFDPMAQAPVPIPARCEGRPGGQHRLLVLGLRKLRAELADLAFLLEKQGRLDAADLANFVGGRIAELTVGGTGVQEEPGGDSTDNRV